MKTDRIDNDLSYEKLNWVVEHSDDGLFLVVASAAMQREVARRYAREAVAVFDYSREERPFRVGSFSRLLEREPGKRAYFFLSFQLAIPTAEDVERFNFCRDILARERLNLVFFVNQETHNRLNRGAMDLYSFIRLFMPFSDELAEETELLTDTVEPDRSTCVELPAPDFTLPRRQLLGQAQGGDPLAEASAPDPRSRFRCRASCCKENPCRARCRGAAMCGRRSIDLQ